MLNSRRGALVSRRNADTRQLAASTRAPETRNAGSVHVEFVSSEGWVLDTDRVCPSARPHPIDELLARGALQQCVSHLVDIFGAGKLGEQVGQLPGCLLAKLPFDLPTKNQGLTLLAPLPGSL